MDAYLLLCEGESEGHYPRLYIFLAVFVSRYDVAFCLYAHKISCSEFPICEVLHLKYTSEDIDSA